jgi:hypothetical protein
MRVNDPRLDDELERLYNHAVSQLTRRSRARVDLQTLVLALERLRISERALRVAINMNSAADTVRDLMYRSVTLGAEEALRAEGKIR